MLGQMFWMQTLDFCSSYLSDGCLVLKPTASKHCAHHTMGFFWAKS